MDEQARGRLRDVMHDKGVTGAEIGREFDWGNMYVARLLRGNIQRPSAERISKICGYLGVSFTWVMTGQTEYMGREQLLKDLESYDDDALAKVAAFVKEQGLDQSGNGSES